MGQSQLKEELEHSCKQHREPYEKCLGEQYQKWLEGKGYKEEECAQFYEDYRKCFTVPRCSFIHSCIREVDAARL